MARYAAVIEKCARSRGDNTLWGEEFFGEAMHKLDKPQGRESYKAGSSSPESPLLWWKSGDDWQQFSYTLGGGE